MGQLVDGIWHDVWYDTSKTGGTFKRTNSEFRNWITQDGSPGPNGDGGFKAESGRYHLYVSHACPWAHRTLIFRKLKELSEHISVDVVHPDMLKDGWTFETDENGATGDRQFNKPFLRDIYLLTDPNISGRVTVPILWDKQKNMIVSNESSEIIRMFNSAFNTVTGNKLDLYPTELHSAIKHVNQKIYETLNNGVYRCGFATTQIAYDAAVIPLFETLGWLENQLSNTRYLLGSEITEADWRLFPTLVRFDSVYNVHFKCSQKRIIDYPNLWAYTRELYQHSGIAETVNLHHIIRHYHFSHETINPNRIIPINPILDWYKPHGRGN